MHWRGKAWPAARFGWGAGALLLASVAADPEASAGEPPGRGVSVVWVSAAESCTVDPAAVFVEVGRVLRRTPLRVSWRAVSPGSESGDDEVRVVGLGSDPARRPHPPLGVTSRLVDGAVWVVCSEVARTIGSGERTASPRLNVAVGRVVAHELVHVVFPGFRHTPRGLMAAVVDPMTLTDPAVELDGPVCRDLGRRLRRDALAPREAVPPATAVGGGQP